MPEVLRRSLSVSSFLGVWQIEEQEEELMSQLVLDADELSYLSSIKVQEKRLQWLASRLLIRRIVNPPGQIIMEWNKRGKPVIINYDFEVTISHSRQMAAVVVGESVCGVDIEKVDPKIGRIARKFVREDERSFIQPPYENEMCTLIWGVKESLFKFIGGGGVDFKENLRILPFSYSQKGVIDAHHISNGVVQQNFKLGFEILNHEYALVWVA